MKVNKYKFTKIIRILSYASSKTFILYNKDNLMEIQKSILLMNKTLSKDKRFLNNFLKSLFHLYNSIIKIKLKKQSIFKKIISSK